MVDGVELSIEKVEVEKLDERNLKSFLQNAYSCRTPREWDRGWIIAHSKPREHALFHAANPISIPKIKYSQRAVSEELSAFE